MTPTNIAASETTPWTPWPGGTCPEDPAQEVQVIFRKMIDGDVTWANGPAGSFDWAHATPPADNDIMVYRKLGG